MREDPRGLDAERCSDDFGIAEHASRGGRDFTATSPWVVVRGRLGAVRLQHGRHEVAEHSGRVQGRLLALELPNLRDHGIDAPLAEQRSHRGGELDRIQLQPLFAPRHRSERFLDGEHLARERAFERPSRRLGVQALGEISGRLGPVTAARGKREKRGVPAHLSFVALEIGGELLRVEGPQRWRFFEPGLLRLVEEHDETRDQQCRRGNDERGSREHGRTRSFAHRLDAPLSHALRTPRLVLWQVQREFLVAVRAEVLGRHRTRAYG